MDKHICIREAYDYIYVGNQKNQLTKTEFDELIKYLEDKKHNFNSTIIDIKYNKVRLINYVGIIKLKNVIIEIIPKISLSNDKTKDKEILLQMLSNCKSVPFTLNDNMNLSIKNYNLLDLFAKYFIEKLKKELSKGVYREYTNVEENSNYIKGKLILSKHIKLNSVNKTKAYCSYDEYNDDNFLNLTFNYACDIISKKVINSDLKRNILRIKSYFSSDFNYTISKDKILKYRFNRQNIRFREVYEFAKLIIFGNSMENGIGDNECFSMLFEINTLFEEYIRNIISRIWTTRERECLLQDKDNYLLINSYTGYKSFNLRPDIVLNDKIKNHQIINNSWDLNKPFIEKTIRVETVRLDDINSTIYDIKSIISNF